MSLFPTKYLDERDVSYVQHHHRKAIPAQELAATLHLTGYQMAKPVILWVDGRLWMAVIPAPLRVDEELVAKALGASSVRLATEQEFGGRFPTCELGAEPPLGRFFQMPMIMDGRLANYDFVFFRAGSHEEALEMRYLDFERLERPRVAEIARAPAQRRWGVHWESQELAHPSHA